LPKAFLAVRFAPLCADGLTEIRHILETAALKSARTGLVIKFKNNFFKQSAA